MLRLLALLLALISVGCMSLAIVGMGVAVQAFGGYARLLQTRHLIRHEGDERGNHGLPHIPNATSRELLCIRLR